MYDSVYTVYLTIYQVRVKPKEGKHNFFQIIFFLEINMILGYAYDGWS